MICLEIIESLQFKTRLTKSPQFKEQYFQLWIKPNAKNLMNAFMTFVTGFTIVVPSIETAIIPTANLCWNFTYFEKVFSTIASVNSAAPACKENPLGEKDSRNSSSITNSSSIRKRTSQPTATGLPKQSRLI